jgi:hypothetical protein
MTPQRSSALADERPLNFFPSASRSILEYWSLESLLIRMIDMNVKQQSQSRLLSTPSNPRTNVRADNDDDDARVMLMMMLVPSNAPRNMTLLIREPTPLQPPENSESEDYFFSSRQREYPRMDSRTASEAATKRFVLQTR